MIGGFQFAFRAVFGIRLVVEPAVGYGTAEAFVEEQEQQGHLHAFAGELVGVAGAVAFQEPMAFQLAQIVAELVESIGFRGELKSSEDGFMDLSGSPTSDGVAAVQENFQ